MADPITITTLLYGAAVAVGDSAVKEATKDAYTKLKGAVGSLFGLRATKAAEKLDAADTREQGRTELVSIIPAELNADEATELAPLVDVLVKALREDAPARETAQGRMGLDLDVGGDALIRKIQGVREMAVRATTKGNFTLEDVSMKGGNGSGN